MAKTSGVYAAPFVITVTAQTCARERRRKTSSQVGLSSENAAASALAPDPPDKGAVQVLVALTCEVQDG